MTTRKQKHYNPDGTQMTQEQMREEIRLMMKAIKDGLGLKLPKEQEEWLS